MRDDKKDIEYYRKMIAEGRLRCLNCGSDRLSIQYAISFVEEFDNQLTTKTSTPVFHGVFCMDCHEEIT